MSQKDLRAQRQLEQDQRRLSLQRNNAYFVVRSITPDPIKNHDLPITSERARSCSPSTFKGTVEMPEQVQAKHLCLSTGSVTPAVIKTTTPPVHARSTMTASSAEQAPKTNSLCAAPSAKKSSSTIQTGIDRYIQIKRKLSPQNSSMGNKPKINCDITRQKTNMPNNDNRFAILADDLDDLPNSDKDIKKTPKPPPIYIREKSSSALVNKIMDLIGKDSFHIIPLTKGNIHETKVQVKTEVNFRALTKYLNDAKKNFYTYQLKSSKGLQIVIKGLELEINPEEISGALIEQGFKPKSVINIFNKDKKPQPLSKVELEPDSCALKKNESHPIYKLQYLLHRRISVEEPHKRKGPVQCVNCQEYSHTKTYCTLRTVCVAWGELHSSVNCPSNKADPGMKKCSNCGGNHTANYRGCPVYKDLKNRLHQKVTMMRGQSTPSIIIPSKHTPDVHLNSLTNRNVTFASALKSGLASTNPTTPFPLAVQNKVNADQLTGQPQGNIETMIFNLQQSMTEFMTFMRTTMENL